VFDGVFNDLTPAQCVALLSSMFDMPKTSQIAPLTPELQGAFNRLQKCARIVAKVSAECGILNLPPDQYVAWFQPNLMGVTFAWCQGSSFTQICSMTDMFEGNIIRTMRRLDELLTQLREAAKSIGNSELDVKLTEGTRLLKRGIIFAGSLYLE